jgi:flagellar protein FlaF
MDQLSCAQVLDDSALETRHREREAFERAVALLELAEESGPESSDAAEALFFLQRLWAILMGDLGPDENALPEPLRTSLISTGMWIAKEVEAIRAGRTKSFLGLIHVNAIICEGIR